MKQAKSAKQRNAKKDESVENDKWGLTLYAYWVLICVIGVVYSEFTHFIFRL